MKNQEDLIKLESMLKDFDIPFYKRTLNKNNLIWLDKNLIKRNKENPNFEKTLDLVKVCLKDRNYYN